MTRAELGMLRKLVQTEMALMGYTSKSRYPDRLAGRYHPKNKHIWPSRLKKLATLERKLNAQITDMDEFARLMPPLDGRGPLTPSW
jgi:hypothetical protein